ncbi:hypothetical protein SAMN05216337_1001202 [Bradyrhizobium brasilense]|uniref:Uncharacterized protein n=1 Tax=Bradyrhizobium brasilense TaxID=1419277 RepID=A0A1G6IND5_9BRAD|nr:hypothetical protein [Bradyrhizobium brasilense]SDC07931.1 hypothetical protein SAMN05216337_1001202 [Bradyrhizobium brasilense]
MISVIAIICKLAAPADCHGELVTTSDMASVSLQSCLMGAPQLAEWMQARPGYRLQGWRCVVGGRGREA